MGITVWLFIYLVLQILQLQPYRRVHLVLVGLVVLVVLLHQQGLGVLEVLVRLVLRPYRHFLEDHLVLGLLEVLVVQVVQVGLVGMVCMVEVLLVHMVLLEDVLALQANLVLLVFRVYRAFLADLLALEDLASNSRRTDQELALQSCCS